MNEEWVQINDAAFDPGWYAVAVCWDAHEGFYPYAFFWDGQRWATRVPVPAVLRSSITFATAELADDWAAAHDPER